MRMRFFRKSPVFDPDEILADTIASGSLSGTEGKLEKPISGWYARLFLVVIFFGFAYLAIRAHGLQIVEGNEYFRRSQANRFLVRPILPARGIIYDRFRRPLVENYPSFTVLLDRKEFAENRGDFAELTKKLSDLFGEVFSILNDGEAVAYEKSGQTSKQVLLEGVTPEQIVALGGTVYSLPGVQLVEDFRRVYENPFAFSHLTGFVGRVSVAELRRGLGFSPEDVVGKSGVELAFDVKLRGHSGRKISEVDASGKETKFRLLDEPEQGGSVVLTIDSELQSTVYRIVNEHSKGGRGASVIAVDPQDGAIRALVSYPGYDVNKFGSALSRQEFTEIVENPLKPLFNRALSGEFPPGSTIKPLIGAAALEEQVIAVETLVDDRGYIEIPNPYVPGEKSVFVGTRKLGLINFFDAIALSSNIYFYTIGGGFEGQRGLGIRKIKQYASAFGLGTLLGVDVPGERRGNFPDPEWKGNAEPDNPTWRIGDTYNVSIGQGGIRVTPLQMAMAMAVIANGGTLYQPHVFDSLFEEGSTGGMIITDKFLPKIIREKVVSAGVLEKVRAGMRRTVTHGLTKSLSLVPVSVAAKTGTAQVGSLSPHAWVATMAPHENPELVLLVMVEHAGEGSTIAVPIAREILQWYFSPEVVASRTRHGL